MNNSKLDNDWDPCHPGLLHEAADVAVSRRRLCEVICAGAAVGMVGGGAIASFFWFDPKREKPPTMPVGIACITVRDHLLAYIADNLPDATLKKRIFSHLCRCPSCRKKYDTLRCSKTSGCGTRPEQVTLKPCTINPPKP